MSEIPEGLELELHREDGGRQRHPRHPWAHRFHLFRCWEKWRHNSRKVLNPGYPNRCIQREPFPDEKKMTFLNPIKCYKLLQVGRSGIDIARLICGSNIYLISTPFSGSGNTDNRLASSEKTKRTIWCLEFVKRSKYLLKSLHRPISKLIQKTFFNLFLSNLLLVLLANSSLWTYLTVRFKWSFILHFTVLKKVTLSKRNLR